ncbi:hypothetical protein QQG55_37630 [Brugia pahangi]
MHNCATECIQLNDAQLFLPPPTSPQEAYTYLLVPLFSHPHALLRNATRHARLQSTRIVPGIAINSCSMGLEALHVSSGYGMVLIKIFHDSDKRSNN